MSSQLVYVTENDVEIGAILINSEFIRFIMNLLNSRYAYSNLNIEFSYTSLSHCTIHFKTENCKIIVVTCLIFELENLKDIDENFVHFRPIHKSKLNQNDAGAGKSCSGPCRRRACSRRGCRPHPPPQPPQQPQAPGGCPQGKLDFLITVIDLGVNCRKIDVKIT